MDRMRVKLTKLFSSKPVNSYKVIIVLLAVMLLIPFCGAAFSYPSNGEAQGADGDRLESIAPPFDFVPGEVLVKFRSGVSRARAEMIKSLAGVETTLKEIGPEGLEDLHLIKLGPGISLTQAIQFLTSLAEVEYAEPNYLAKAVYTSYRKNSDEVRIILKPALAKVKSDILRSHFACLLADVLMRKGPTFFADAEQYFQKALRGNPVHHKALIGLANLYRLQ